MPPGGTKRVRATPATDPAPGVATRSGKKYTNTHPEASTDEQSNLQQANNVEASMGHGEEEQPRSPVLDWSIFDEQNIEDEVQEDLEVVPKGK